MEKAKFNICWISILVIFVGSIVYPVMLENANHLRKNSKVQVYVPQNIAPIQNTPAPTVTKTPVVETKIAFKRDLKMGDRGEDVMRLQKYLNAQGFLVAESGTGSPGHETELFGAGTRDALIKFQEHYANILLKPYGLTQGTGYFGAKTRELVNS